MRRQYPIIDPNSFERQLLEDASALHWVRRGADLKRASLTGMRLDVANLWLTYMEELENPDWAEKFRTKERGNTNMFNLNEVYGEIHTL